MGFEIVSDQQEDITVWGETGFFSGKEPLARPYVLALRTTTRCQTGCPHCCLESTPNGTDMPLNLVEDLCRAAKRNDIRVIHLTGGEPLLHPNLEDIIGVAHKEGLGVEMVTSLYSPDLSPVDQRLDGFWKAGLRRIMVSFDDGHAKKVSLTTLASFLKKAVDVDLDTAVNVVEWRSAQWTRDRVRQRCLELNVPVGRISWFSSQLSRVGRGKVLCVPGEEVAHRDARCAFSLTSPTVNPNGEVVVCCNVDSDIPTLLLGNVSFDSLEGCLSRLMEHPICRINAAVGPFKAWLASGFSQQNTPFDPCGTCLSVMEAASRPAVMANLESLSRSLPQEISLDYEALNTWCQRAIPRDALIADRSNLS